MRLRNKNNGVCESKERKKNNLGKVFNCDEHQQKISKVLFWSSATFAYRVSTMFFGYFWKALVCGDDFEGLTRAFAITPNLA